jgi:hypothetical protein
MVMGRPFGLTRAAGMRWRGYNHLESEVAVEDLYICVPIEGPKKNACKATAGSFGVLGVKDSDIPKLDIY